ncbi:MAG: rhomboid family intramembrane serine protease [Gammaproteobacteria bacterium]|nr:rhomboid family intramembrane serine protease [Gammaproteobacteria bacterium]
MAARGRRFAIASLTFACLLGLAFGWQLLATPGGLAVPAGLSFIPGNLFGGAELPAGALLVPPPATLVTYQFLHAGWFHILGNLVFLRICGPRVEGRLGSGPWTVLLLASGLVAALAQAWPDPSSALPMVGASGGISGLLGACLYLHSRDERHRPGMQLPAWLVLISWCGMQLLHSSWVEDLPGAIAFRAHVGGFACGLLLTPVLHLLALLSADARPVARTLRSRDSSH